MNIKEMSTLINESLARFMPHPPSLGIEIGYESIKLALTKEENPASVRLLDYAVIASCGKNLTEKSALLKDALKEMNIASNTQAKIIISGPDVDSKRITLPYMPKDEMAKALRWEAKDHFLLNIEDAALDFEILQEEPQEVLNKNVEVVAVISKNSLIDEKLSALKEIGLAPAGIIPAAYALYNLYRLCKKQEEGPIAILDMGALNTTIVIVKENKLRFTRQLGYAGANITKAMAGAFMSDRGKIELSLEAAEAIKREIGIPQESQEIIKEGITAAQINSMLRPMIEKAVTDLKGSFDYYSSQFKEGSIAKVYITGGTSKLKNMVPRLSQRLSMPVEPLYIPEGLKLGLAAEKLSLFNEDFSVTAPAIGAALSSIGDVNLIPESYKAQEKSRAQFILTRMAFIAILSIFLTMYLLNIAHEKVLRSVLTAKQPQWQQLAEIQNLHTKISQKNNIINQTLKNQISLYYVFKSLSNLTPPAACLETIAIKDKANTMIIKGAVFSTAETPEVTIARFIKTLEASPFFGNVNLVSSQDKEVSGKSAVEFEINCKLIK